MKLNLRLRRANMEHGKSVLQKLIEAPYTLIEWLHGEDKSSLGWGVPGDTKTNLEGSKGLTASTRINPNGVPLVEFSDGSSYTDYDKLSKDDAFKKLLDRFVEHGSLKLATIYKPDGTSFRTTLMLPEAQAPKSSFGPTAAPG